MIRIPPKQYLLLLEFGSFKKTLKTGIQKNSNAYLQKISNQ